MWLVIYITVEEVTVYLLGEVTAAHEILGVGDVTTHQDYYIFHFPPFSSK